MALSDGQGHTGAFLFSPFGTDLDVGHPDAGQEALHEGNVYRVTGTFRVFIPGISYSFRSIANVVQATKIAQLGR